jgi:hypothetical protein
MLPANNIALSANEMNHLNYDGKLLHISLSSLYHDYRCAIIQLIALLENGNLKNKQIQFDNLISLGNG